MMQFVKFTAILSDRTKVCLSLSLLSQFPAQIVLLSTTEGSMHVQTFVEPCDDYAMLHHVATRRTWNLPE